MSLAAPPPADEHAKNSVPVPDVPNGGVLFPVEERRSTAVTKGRSAPDSPCPGRWTVADSLVALCAVVYAYLLYGGLWGDIERAYLVNSGPDQNMWEWFFAVVADGVAEGRVPLFTELQNAPLGVNLMANTAMYGLSVPLAPVTWAFGPTATFALALTGSLAGSAVAWYWVFSRHLVRYRAAAVVGAAVTSFGPPVISHSSAHVNFVAWFVLPFIAMAMIRITQGVRPLRNGVVLGLLTALQIFLGEELLLIFGVLLLVVGVVLLAPRWREFPDLVRPMAIGFGTGLAVALGIVAYPLWFQFAGPQSYAGLDFDPFGNDTVAFTRTATQSLSGVPSAIAEVSLNEMEENAAFGWSLIVLMVVVSAWLWRDRLARALAVGMYTMALLSAGATLVVARVDTGIPLPWALLDELPLFDTVLMSRFAMGCLPAIGALLALATSRVLDLPTIGAADPTVPIRLIWGGALLAALLPIVPLGQPVASRAAVPAFIEQGTWRQFVDPGGTVVSVPLASPDETEPLHWQVRAGLGFNLTAGCFVGPKSPDDPAGRYGAALRPTTAILEDVRRTGITRSFNPTQRAQAQEDLRYWNADVLVLAPGRNDVALRRTVDDLLGMPSRVAGGVWLWDVRART